MKTKSELYTMWAGEFLQNLNNDELHNLEGATLQEAENAAMHLSDKLKLFLIFWKNDLPENRALFYQRFGNDIRNEIEKVTELIYPINVQNLEYIKQFIDFVISINQGSSLELATLETNKAQFDKIRGIIELKIEKIKKENIKSVQENEPVQFATLFKKTSHYNHVMKLLVDKQLIHTGTYFWIEEKGGKITYLISIIKTIKTKKYLKPHVKLSNKTIKSITLEHFGVVIAMSTIEKHRISSTLINDLDFIPLSSTIS